MSKTKPKVSVIMAEYNTNPQYFKEAVDSVLKQTYKNFEFIIVDDSGVNRVEKLLDGYDDNRIRVIKNPGNKGFVYALNNGIKNAKNDYIIRMDTDDISASDRFEIIVNYAVRHPEYAVVSSRAVEFSGKEEFGVIGIKGEKTEKEVMRGDVPIHAAAIMRKKEIEDIGLYKDDYLRAEDLALWCGLLIAGKRLYMLDDVLYRYRVNPHDYQKRTLCHRGGEIKARLHYYPKMGAGLVEYFRIVTSIAAGLLPTKVVRIYRNKFVARKG